MAFVKFMRNKFFHPHTYENQKRTWIAEQNHASEKKRQEELHKQYLKEQAIYENKNLLKTGKLTQDDKLAFMYEPPMECRKKDDKLELREVRFEWQKNAPRAGEYAKNLEVTDRPFGIEVRNTKCIKCGVWGHMNTDKICPLYNQGLNTEDNPPELGKEDPMSLLNSMEKGGLRMRKHAINSVMDVHDNKYSMLEERKLDPEVAFIANLTDKQKRKLMKKLNKSETGNVSKVKKQKKDKKKKKKRKIKEEEMSDTDSPSSPPRNKYPRKQRPNEYSKNKEYSPKRISSPSRRQRYSPTRSNANYKHKSKQSSSKDSHTRHRRSSQSERRNVKHESRYKSERQEGKYEVNYDRTRSRSKTPERPSKNKHLSPKRRHKSSKGHSDNNKIINSDRNSNTHTRKSSASQRHDTPSSDSESDTDKHNSSRHNSKKSHEKHPQKYEVRQSKSGKQKARKRAPSTSESSSSSSDSD